MKALTISAFTKSPLNWFSFSEQKKEARVFARASFSVLRLCLLDLERHSVNEGVRGYSEGQQIGAGREVLILESRALLIFSYGPVA
jgi:hypothetical protein